MTAESLNNPPKPGSDLPTGPEAPEPGSPAAAILDAAKRHFAATGFSGTSTRRIAETAGVNLAMIHYYFGNKENLYRQVVQTEFASLFRIIRRNMDEAVAPEEFLPRMPAFILELHREHPEIMPLLRREMNDGAPRLPQMLSAMGGDGPLGMRRFLEKSVAAARERGFGTDIPPDHLLAMMFSLANGLMAFAPLIREIFELDLMDRETAAAVGRSAGMVVRRMLAPEGKE